MLLLVTVSVKLCAWSPGPAVMPDRLIVCGPGVFSTIGVGFGIGLSWGCWLTGVTVTVKLRLD